MTCIHRHEDWFYSVDDNRKVKNNLLSTKGNGAGGSLDSGKWKENHPFLSNSKSNSKVQCKVCRQFTSKLLWWVLFLVFQVALEVWQFQKPFW